MRVLNPVERQWLFEPEALKNLPSSIHGIPLEKELRKRRRIILSIRSLALRTGLCSPDDPNSKGAKEVVTVAATLIHRFYMRRSFEDFSEELMAGTILFLASKIEEEPLKLRHICNSCLDKFENDRQGGWHPTDDHGPPPSHAYQRWEREILATEEIVLETLCFDMGIEQPWVTLRRCIRGVDELGPNHDQSQSQPRPTTSTPTNGTNVEKGHHIVSEAIVAELGWSLLNEASLSPLPILHPAPILAFTTFILIISTVERVSKTEATAIASDLSGNFDLDLSCDESGALSGSDLAEIQRCLSEYTDYCRMGLIDPGYCGLITKRPRSSEPESGIRNIRRYRLPNPTTAKSTSASTPIPDAKSDVKPVVKTPLASVTSASNGHGHGNGNGTHSSGHDQTPKPSLKSPASIVA